MLAVEIRPQDVNKITAACQVHQNVIVEVDPLQHRYYPFMVKLPRCAGGVHLANPSVKRCVPSTYNSVPYSMYMLPSYETATVNLVHHTGCKGECVKTSSSCNIFENWNENQCLCKCKYSAAPSPSPCKLPLIWQQSACNCVCPSGLQMKCPDTKEWDKETCSCTCKKRYLNRCAKKRKVVNEENCKCMQPPSQNVTASARGSDAQCNGVENKIVVMIVVIEFLGMLFIFFLIYRCCLKEVEDKSVDTWKKRVKYEVNTTLQRMTVRRNKDASQQVQDQEMQPENAHETFLQNENVKKHNGDKPESYDLRDQKNDGIDRYNNVREEGLPENQEQPVGFYHGPHDKFGSDANIPMGSEGQVTPV